MNNPKISLVAALSENGVIGKGNQLPWHISADLQHFKKITSGHPVIMGRKTYESMGRLLPNRTNIIITRDLDYSVEGAVIVHSLEQAIEEGGKVLSIKYQVSSIENKNEVFIIGGGQIFEQAISIADKLYLTLVHTKIEGDAFFPDYTEFIHEISRQEVEENGLHFTFLELEREEQD
jgi:dihydrofolate reductase